MSTRLLRRLTAAALVLALGIIMLGAWVRLNDAGLGCPDWPGCYGHALVQPGAGVEPAKAWKEMIHRYFAGSFGLLVMVLAVIAWRRGKGRERWLLPLAALVVVFQAALGAWTVTMKLEPAVVMGHLLGGFTMAVLLWLTWLGLIGSRPVGGVQRGLVTLSRVALGVIILQVMLGGWTSANYAALACPDFPMCRGSWWPHANFAAAFVPWHKLGVSYQYGVLGGPARVAIQLVHRIGALVTAGVVGTLAVRCLRSGMPRLERSGSMLLALLGLQFALGIGNVLLGLPLPVAVMHNGVAALLVLAVAYHADVLRSARSVAVDASSEAAAEASEPAVAE